MAISSGGIGLAVSFTVLLAVSAHAREESRETVHWTCWLGQGEDHHIHCLHEADPVLEELPDGLPNPYQDERMLSAFFAEGKARNLARVVREAPQDYQTVLWSIPLFSTPFDLEDVRLLATSIMCGTDNRCVVNFNHGVESAKQDPLTLVK